MMIEIGMTKGNECQSFNQQQQQQQQQRQQQHQKQ